MDIEAWLSIVVRQLILYSLPVLISLTLITLLESRLCKTAIAHPFFAISWRGSWLPMLASLAMHRGIIIAPARPLNFGYRAAVVRLAGHLILCAVGFILYAWSLQHPPPTGLPPVHHWWAKVLMFFNLCMAALHLLPLPHMLAGECLALLPIVRRWAAYLDETRSLLVMLLLAASPLLDWLLGGLVVFPIYEQLSILAHALT